MLELPSGKSPAVRDEQQQRHMDLPGAVGGAPIVKEKEEWTSEVLDFDTGSLLSCELRSVDVSLIPTVKWWQEYYWNWSRSSSKSYRYEQHPTQQHGWVVLCGWARPADLLREKRWHRATDCEKRGLCAYRSAPERLFFYMLLRLAW
jgi:hypothetical protein